MAQTLPIPIFKPVYRNVDGAEINDVNARLVNGFLDELGGTTGLPGHSSVITLESGGNPVTSPVQGMYWWKDKQRLVVVSLGKFFYSTYSTATQTWTTTEITVASGTPSTTGVATFAIGFTTGAVETLFIATGGELVYWDGGAGDITKAPIAGDPNISYVAAIDSYVLAAQLDSDNVWHSTAFSPTTWDADDFFSAIGGADDLQAIWVKNREIFLLGEETFEIWENDGETPFRRTSSGFLTDAGCIAPHSVVELNSSIYWLNHRNKIVEYRGGSPSEVSTPFDAQIELIEDTSDCVADTFKFQGKDFLVFHFPGEIDLIYNTANQSWSERGLYLSGSDEYIPLPIHNFLYISEFGKTLCADYVTGEVHEVSGNNYSFDGEDIRVYRQTGHIDYGEDKNKISRRITIKALRGQDVTEATLMFRWKDDNSKYSNWKHLDLGLAGDSNQTLRLNRNGMFRTRQYELAVTSDAKVLFWEARESFDVCST